MHRQDRDRAKMVRDFHQHDINDPLLYNAVWNTGLTPLPEIAAATVELIRARLRTPPPTPTSVGSVGGSVGVNPQ